MKMGTNMRVARGFTLIEVMIVVVVIAILAAIAFPNYADYVKRAKRADAHDSLLRVQLEQEKWRASNPAYTQNLPDLNLDPVSTEEYYEIVITVGSATATGFTVVAQAEDPGQQQDTGCTQIQLSVDAANPQGLRTPPECWARR